MSHEVETLAYAGEVPWHGLGKKVSNDLTPEQMLDEAGLNWEVEKIPMSYTTQEGEFKDVPKKMALVRSNDGSFIDIVGDDWNPLQNQDAFEFFNDFVMAGDMEMHTAGSLQKGRRVFALARVKESFDVVPGDQVDQYLLLSNPHMYGLSIDVRMTPIRVVCMNTMTWALNQVSDQMVRVNHRAVFDADAVKETLGVAKEKLEKYKDVSKFLASKRAKDEDVVEYFKRVFPKGSKNDDVSRNGQKALDILHHQPGHEMAEGSWWQSFNAVTFLTDHELGRTNDNRVTSAWFGANRKLKAKALETAVEMAEAA